MYKYKDQKELRMALNGRMITMISGLFIIMTAITTTLRYGMGLLQSASEAAKGTEDFVNALTQLGVSVGFIRFVAVLLLITTMIEILVGVFSARLSNRLDKADLIFKMSIGLLIVEVILLAFMLRTQMMMLSNVLMPCCLIWGTSQLRKLSKLYPDRIFAVEPKKKEKSSKGSSAQNQAQPQKKSLMDRAMTQAREEEIWPAVGETVENEPTEEKKTEADDVSVNEQ